MCNVVPRPSHRKPRRWKSMLIHQGWFTVLYTQHLLDSQSFEFEICIFPREAIPLHYFPLREDSPRVLAWGYMGKATPIRQLSLSHRCHQIVTWCRDQATENPVGGKACSSTKGGLLCYIPNTYSIHKVSSLKFAFS